MSKSSIREMPHTSTAPVVSRPRQHKPKVRTGCITCKTRRVKCDEAKPTCRRCFLAHVKCDGYKSQQLPIRRQRPLLPRASDTTATSLSLAPASGDVVLLPKTLQTICRSPPNPNPMTPLEGQYFYIFKEHLHSVGGAIGCHIFDQIILQSSHSDAFIRQGVLAVGALIKAWQTCSREPRDPGRVKAFFEDLSDEEKRTHYEYGLQQYNRSVAHVMRQGSSLNLRTILISCWLIAGVEILHQRARVARRQMLIGYRCLMEARAKNSFTYDTGTGLISSGQVYIEEGLIAEFEDFHRFFGDETGNDGNGNQYHIPDSFTSLAPARALFDHLMRSTIQVKRRPCKQHCISSESPENWKSPESDMDHESPASDESHETIEVIGSEMHIDPQGPADQCCAYAVHLQRLTRYREALQPLLRQSKTKATSKDYAIGNVLESQTIILQLTFKAQAFSSRAIFDCIEEFVKIIQLSKEFLDFHVLSNRRGLSRFAFEMGVISPLQFTIANCREPDIRDEALEILRRGIAGEEESDGNIVGKGLAESVGQVKKDEDGDSPDSRGSGGGDKLVGFEFGHYCVQLVEL